MRCPKLKCTWPFAAFFPSACIIKDMPVLVEMQNTGDSRLRSEIAAVIEHIFSERTGEWSVCIVGSRENDNWELKLTGPSEFERSYTLVGAAGEHQPAAIRSLLLKFLRSAR